MSGEPRLVEALGAVLAGGGSRRFGSPKQLARLGGESLLERVLGRLAEVAARVVVIANDPALARGVNAPARPDRLADRGPLGGIHAALIWADELGMRGALCVAGDMPFLEPRLLRQLATLGTAEEVDAVVPASGSPLGFEPLCAWYSAALTPSIEEALLEGPIAPADLLRRVRTRTLPLGQVRRFGDPERLFFNVNTPDALVQARRLEDSMPTHHG